MKTEVLIYDVTNKQSRIEEVEMEFPNPRIAEIDRRLQEITQELAQTDLKTIKYFEGVLSEAEYAESKKDRANLRAAHNALEIERLTLV